MVFQPQGAGAVSRSVEGGIAKRDSDRARYAAKAAKRQSTRNARSHKRGFGTMGSRERFA